MGAAPADSAAKPEADAIAKADAEPIKVLRFIFKFVRLKAGAPSSRQDQLTPDISPASIRAQSENPRMITQLRTKNVAKAK
jgi:hypothetical protein